MAVDQFEATDRRFQEVSEVVDYDGFDPFKSCGWSWDRLAADKFASDCVLGIYQRTSEAVIGTERWVANSDQKPSWARIRSVDIYRETGASLGKNLEP